MTVKWTNQLVLAVIAEARRAGFIAANQKLNDLQTCGAQFTVMDGGEVISTMFDVCGFANLKISARGKFFQLAKKLCSTSQQRFYCCNGYRGGGFLAIYDSTMRQEMSVNVAACKGQAQVLEAYGIKYQIESRID